MYTDWLASAFVYEKLTTCTEGVDTDPAFVNQSTGKPSGTDSIITFGGPIVNPIVKYSESENTPIEDRAPIRYAWAPGGGRFEYWNGTIIPNTEFTTWYASRDMFLIETFQDGDGRLILIMYGYGWRGTYAAGKYFEKNIYPNPESHKVAWLICKWEDTNMDNFVNAPDEGDTYTVIAAG